MRGIVGTVIGVIIITLGLAGLGVALAQMMSNADPNATLIEISGLGVFVAACIATLIMAR